MTKLGRPAKINQVWLDKAEEVISDQRNIRCLTDKKLLFEINYGLDEKHQICQTTFEEYKAWKKLKDPEKAEMLERFTGLYKKALNEQSKWLMQAMLEDSDKWQKYAWIMERKLNEWNLRIITDNTHKGDKEAPLIKEINVNIKK